MKLGRQYSKICNVDSLIRYIREEILGLSLLKFGLAIDISHATCCRYENNDFGKNFQKNKKEKLRKLAESLARVLPSDMDLVHAAVGRGQDAYDAVRLGFCEKIKSRLLTVYQESEFFNQSDFEYLSQLDLAVQENFIGFLYVMLMIFSGESNLLHTTVSSSPVQTYISGTSTMMSDNNSSQFYIRSEPRLPFQKGARYLSYSLKFCVNKLIGLAKPKSMVELCCGIGSMCLDVYLDFPDIHFIHVNHHTETINCVREQLQEFKSFHGELLHLNFYDYIMEQTVLPDLTLMFYSLHHIPHPISSKMEFLKVCRKKMPKHGMLCIADVFLPEGIQHGSSSIMNMNYRANRATESFLRTFWLKLESLETGHIQEAREFANTLMSREFDAFASQTSKEYFISMSALCEIAERLGFTVELSEYVNSIGDGIVLLSY